MAIWACSEKREEEAWGPWSMEDGDGREERSEKRAKSLKVVKVAAKSTEQPEISSSFSFQL
jgi:hypothetical protein